MPRSALLARCGPVADLVSTLLEDRAMLGRRPICCAGQEFCSLCSALHELLRRGGARRRSRERWGDRSARVLAGVTGRGRAPSAIAWAVAMTIGLGCMRLSTDAARDPERGCAVIAAAVEAGGALLDTADAHALDDADAGHNER